MIKCDSCYASLRNKIIEEMGTRGPYAGMSYVFFEINKEENGNYDGTP